MKKIAGIAALLLSVALLVTGCGGQTAQKSTVTVFAAASMTETLTEIGDLYMEQNQDVELVFNFDSSGTLKTQIEEGASADVFISAGQKQMNELTCVEESTRFDLVQNTVVLIVPEGNSAVSSFDDIADGTFASLAIGNSDVPVGQYTQEILTAMGVWEEITSSGKVSYGSNVKEVLSQVASGSVECGIVYKTDAAAEPKVTVADTAPEEYYSPAVYPAAVLTGSKDSGAASDFLTFLTTPEAVKIFTDAGFDMAK